MDKKKRGGGFKFSVCMIDELGDGENCKLEFFFFSFSIVRTHNARTQPNRLNTPFPSLTPHRHNQMINPSPPIPFPTPHRLIPLLKTQLKILH